MYWRPPTPLPHMHNLPLLIHRYVNKCATVPQPPGLADFLKGSLYLYQQSKRGPHCTPDHPRSFDLVVDFSHHPMGVFVTPPPVPAHVQSLINNGNVKLTECFNQYRPVIRNMVTTLQNNPDTSPPVTYAICHEPYDQFDSNESVLDPDDRAFMTSVLNFHPELVDMVDQLLTDLGLTSPYAVLHLRMGDQLSAEQHAHAEHIQHVSAYLEREILPRWGKRVLVLSDSYYTKKYLSTKYGVACTDFVPVHLGESQRFLARGETASPTDIGHTLVEFMLLSRCATVYVFSVYGWNSGFSKLAAHIYGIPYVPITQGK